MKPILTRQLSPLLGLITLSLLVQCGPQEPPLPPKTPVELLEGKWESTCIKARSHGIAEWAELMVSDDDAVLISRISREADCSITDIEVKRDIFLDFEQADPDLSPLTGIEPTVLTTTVEPVTELGASLLRIVKWCGEKDWKAGVKKTFKSPLSQAEEKCLQNHNLPNYFAVRKENTLYFNKPQADVSAKSLDEVFFYRRLK